MEIIATKTIKNKEFTPDHR